MILTLTFSAFAVGEPEVPQDDARRAAAVTLIEHVGRETPFVEEWQTATLGDPIVLYDPSGGVRWELGWTDGMLGLQTITYRVSPVYVRDTP